MSFGPPIDTFLSYCVSCSVVVVVVVLLPFGSVVWVGGAETFRTSKERERGRKTDGSHFTVGSRGLFRFEISDE